MSRKLLILTLLLVGLSSATYSQNKKTALLKGRIINKDSQTPANDVKITLPDLNAFTTTDGNGNFAISEVPYGSQMMIIGPSSKGDTTHINIDKSLVDLGDIYIAPGDRNLSPENAEIPTIPIEYNVNSDDADDGSNASSQNSGGMFANSDDPFMYRIASFYNQYRYRPRGFNDYELQLNGAPIQDLERGSTSWGQFGGLFDVLHSRNVTYGLKPSAYAYGGLVGNTYLDATAANQRKGTIATFTQTNRNYRSSVMLTHNSGLKKNGWAYSVSASRRWANEGYNPGTYYDGYSFFGAVSKVIKKSQFNLTVIGAPTKRGDAMYASTDEAFALAGDNQYNPSWGYQNGKKRSAKEVSVFQPIGIFNYTYSPSDRTRWNTAISYQAGKYKSSGIDRYNAYSPFPDYYKNFPSYYLSLSPAEVNTANAVQAQLQSHPEQLQINWDNLYNSNYMNTETIKNVNGIAGNDVTGKRSLYVLSNSVDAQKTLSFNTNIEHSQNEHLTLYGGLKFVSQTDEYYKEIADLLGGDFYLNVNQFAVQTPGNTNYSQNDVNKPNQIVKTGDKYNYDYIGRILQGDLWGQAVYVHNKIDLFAAADLGNTSFNREGLMKNGLFPNNSYGKSTTQSFLTYKVKGGITYKFDLRNFVYINADYSTEAPAVINTYISPRVRDMVVPDVKVFATKTLEAGYLLKSNIFNARITGYVTDKTDFTTIQRYYNDDQVTFVNYVMKDVNIRSIGTEMSAILKVNETWGLTGLAAIGQTFYTNRPKASIYADNDPTTAAVDRKVYIKDYYLGVGPQSIYSLGVNYRPRNYWRANISFNYLDRNYLDVAPDRRTQEATDLITPGSAQWNNIVDQQKLPAAFTIDVNASKSFSINHWYKKLHHPTSLYLSVGISNLLNNQNIKTGGYEQLRYDYNFRNPDKFAGKYDYAYGINFFATISLRF